MIVEVGGGIRAYDPLDGYEVGEMARSGRGQVLAPWPNRIAEGRYEFDGVPIGLVVGLLLAAAVAARYVRSFFNLLLSTER